MSSYELKDIKQLDNKQRPLTIQDGKDIPDDVTGLPNVVVAQPDRYNLVFIILLIHGIGTLMPWNMFINAQDYFRNYKLASSAVGNTTGNIIGNVTNVDEEELDNLRKNFLSYLSLAAQVPNVLFNGLNLLVNIGSGNLKLRVNVTLALEVIIFTATIILAIVDSSQWPVAFFYLTMVSVVILNMASGIYQNCIFGTGAKFPGSYTNAILIGSNFSGTFTSIVNLLSIWLAPKPQEAAIYYFVTALFVILICIVSYNLLDCNRYFKSIDSRPEDTSVDEGLEDNSFLGDLEKKWQVFLKCWPQCLNVFFTFYVTLALFPAIIANIQQVGDNFSNRYFSSFACFFIFNVFAMIGNLFSGWTTWPGKQRVWIIVVARVIFVPFFLFCNFNPYMRHWPVLIGGDAIFIIGNILLALSSGYLSSLCMMFASSDLEVEEAPKAGMLAAFFLVLGIFLGVYSSFFLTWIVEL